MARTPLITVFISSPIDVDDERKRAELVISRLDNIWRAHVRLEARLWERKHYEAATGFQQAIGEMAKFDVVIGILWKRVGSEISPETYARPDGSAYESGTVFELETAIASSEKTGRPAVYLLRKTKPVTYPAASVDEDRRQNDLLQAWWDRTVRDAEGHFLRGYQGFVETDDFEALLESVLEDYLRDKHLIPDGAAWDVKTRGSPYPGLVAYDEAHSDVFFGRSLATAAALDDLREAAKRERPALFIVGPSGSGKSSLARGGVSPRLSAGFFEGIDFWRPILIEPAEDPLAAFASRLYATGGLPELQASPQSTPKAFVELAKDAPEGAASSVRWALESAAKSEPTAAAREKALVARLLITVDQLEIIMGSSSWRPLARLLRALVESQAAWLVATLRSDRYGDLQADADLMALRTKGALFDLPAPGASEITEIIKAPAHAAGLVFEEQEGRTLDRVLQQAVSGPDALPLLQMTLAKLFEERRGETLTFDAYNALDGLEGAIAAHAGAVFATVSPAGQAALDGLLRNLVADIDDAGRLTLRTPRRDSLVGASELVDRFVQGRLLISAGGDLRIAHEALLRRWKRAAESPALLPEVIRLRRQIEPSCEVWGRTGLDSDLLQPGSTALAAADRIAREHPGALGDPLEPYVRASVQFAESRQRAELDKANAAARRARRGAAIVMAFALLFAGVAALAFGLYRQANHSYGLALLTKAEQLLLEDDPARALVTAAAAARLSGGSDAGIRAQTIAEIAQPAHVAAIWSLKLSRPADATALSDDGQFAIGDNAGEILIGQTEQAAGVAPRPTLSLNGPRRDILRLRFLPGGHRLVSATSDGVVVWDLASRTAQLLCGSPQPLVDVTADPKGRYIAAVGDQGQVVVWDARSANGQPITAARTLATLNPSAWLVVAFSPDGARFAASDADGAVHVFDVSDTLAAWREQPALSLQTSQTDLIGLAFSPDATRLAAAAQKGVVQLWSLAGGAPSKLQSLDRPVGKLWGVAFTPDGSKLVTAGWDGAARFWDSSTLAPLGVVDAHDHWVLDFALSQDSRRLLTVSQDGAAKFWDVASLSPMTYAIRDNPAETIRGRYSADGSHFVTAGRDGFARLYSVSAAGAFSLDCVADNGAWVTAVAFSADGERFASVGQWQTAIHIWDVDAADGGRCRDDGQISTGSTVATSLAWSPAHASELAWGGSDGGVRIVNVGSGPQPAGGQRMAGAGHSGEVAAVAYNDSGARLASGGGDGRVVVWDVAGRRLLKVLRSGGQGVGAVRFFHDGRLITGGDDGAIQVWDLSGANPMRALTMQGGVSAMALSADNSVLAAGGDGRAIVMWRTTDWRQIFALNALAGARGAWDFNPKRGDLAFDGEDGLVRVLPHATAPWPLNPGDLNATLVGTDVHFDRGPATVSAGQSAVSVTAACQAAR
jgi:WD40 repeat protein